jgi:phosphatidylserine decarboxylase
VAAVLVASMRFHAVDVLLNLRYKGANEIPCDARYVKGQEMGWFEHGSTILLFMPPGYAMAQGLENGVRIRMGEPLLRRIA